LAVLFGVFLAKTSAALTRFSGISHGWAVATVTCALVITSALTTFFVGARINTQVGEASEHLGRAQAALVDAAQKYPTLGSTMRSTPYLSDLIDIPAERAPANSSQVKETADSGKPENLNVIDAVKPVASQAMQSVTRVFATSFGLVVNSLLIFFVGLFLAINPSSYRDGIVRLFPIQRRARMTQVFNKIGDTLWKWLLGRFGSMLVTGFGAGGLLFALGVPMSFTLGLVTAALTFVPNIGGFIALMLSVLFAAPQGANTMLLVVVGYVGLQLIESYVVTPLIQRSQISLPPALLIAFQAILGVAFGLLGAAIASPLLAALKVGVEELYIHDVLEKEAA
ncbi:MAG: AI-2E family transporter, partial [Planctomycetales bacterium]|nr:AI-2E family transporter [Planctomycetales bacterium]